MSLTRTRWRLSLTLVCLFASTFQGLVAQTHVHNAASTEFAAAGALAQADSDLASLESQKHSGTTRDNTACPLCQILMFGGGLPAAAFHVPVRAVTSVAHALLEQVPACFIAAISYAWQSRGPPRA